MTVIAQVICVIFRNLINSVSVSQVLFIPAHCIYTLSQFTYLVKRSSNAGSSHS